MKFILTSSYCLLLFLAAMQVNGQNEIIRFDFEGKTIPVRIIIPEDYTPDKAYPVLIGPGLDGGDLNMGCRYFGPQPERHGWILVESSIHMENRKAASLLLNHLETNYSTRGIFILGFSANSVDAFDIGSIYNDRIDGIIGMPGNPDSRNISKHQNQHILMIVGERDTNWRKRAEKAKVVLENEGYQNNLVIIPDGGHILDELTGEPLFSILNKKLLYKGP